MDAAGFVFIGCELSLASQLIPLFVDTQTEAVIDKLLAYSCASCRDFDNQLKADGICLFGHGDLVKEVIFALVTEDQFYKTAAACVLGSELNQAKTMIPLFREENYDTVRNTLKVYASGSHRDLDDKLKSAGIVVFGDGEYVRRLIVDLTMDKKISREHNIYICVASEFGKLDLTEKPKSEAQKIQELIELGTDTEKLAEMVRSAKENHNYPTKEEMIQLFESAFAASKTKEGDEALLYDQICRDLKEMLYAVHRQEMVKKLEDSPPGRRFLGGFTIGK